MKRSSDPMGKKESENIFIRILRRLVRGKKKKTGSTYPLR